MASLFSSLFRFASQNLQQYSFRQFHALPNTISSNAVVSPTITNPWSLDSLRTIVRNNFPRARENKRLYVHGWRTKLRTKNGRRQIMRRILKGRWYYTH